MSALSNSSVLISLLKVHITMKPFAFACAAVLIGLSFQTPGYAQDKRQEQILAYRQGNMALVGANFGPMGAMLKGEIPFNLGQVQAYARDLAAVTSIDMMRGYPAGSEGGRTKSKPDIWLDLDDFGEKMQALTDAAAELNATAASGNRNAIETRMKAVGKTCKSCHSDYKSKTYLNE